MLYNTVEELLLFCGLSIPFPRNRNQNFDFSTKVFLFKFTLIDEFQMRSSVFRLFSSLENGRKIHDRFRISSIVVNLKRNASVVKSKFRFRFRGKRIDRPQKYNNSSRCKYYILATISVNFTILKVDRKLTMASTREFLWDLIGCWILNDRNWDVESAKSLNIVIWSSGWRAVPNAFQAIQKFSSTIASSKPTMMGLSERPPSSIASKSGDYSQFRRGFGVLKKETFRNLLFRFRKVFVSKNQSNVEVKNDLRILMRYSKVTRMRKFELPDEKIRIAWNLIRTALHSADQTTMFNDFSIQHLNFGHLKFNTRLNL